MPELRIVHAAYKNGLDTPEVRSVNTVELTTWCGENAHKNDVKVALDCLSRVTCEACLDYLSDTLHGDDRRRVLVRRREILEGATPAPASSPGPRRG